MDKYKYKYLYLEKNNRLIEYTMCNQEDRIYSLTMGYHNGNITNEEALLVGVGVYISEEPIKLVKKATLFFEAYEEPEFPLDYLKDAKIKHFNITERDTFDQLFFEWYDNGSIEFLGRYIKTRHQSGINIIISLIAQSCLYTIPYKRDFKTQTLLESKVRKSYIIYYDENNYTVHWLSQNTVPTLLTQVIDGKEVLYGNVLVYANNSKAKTWHNILNNTLKIENRLIYDIFITDILTKYFKIHTELYYYKNDRPFNLTINVDNKIVGILADRNLIKKQRATGRLINITEDFKEEVQVLLAKYTLLGKKKQMLRIYVNSKLEIKDYELITE